MNDIAANDALIAKYGKPCDKLSYRGFDVLFWDDDPGQQIFAVWDGKEIGFGAYNHAYIEDMKALIDNKLDTIAHSYGWRLVWFTNGWGGARDIKLEVRTRTVKIWLVEKPEKLDLDKLAAEAKTIAEAFLKADEERRKSSK